MAMPGLQGNRKFKRLARALDAIAYRETQVRGFGQALALGSLELLWAGCWEALDDALGTPDDVEDAAGWAGERGVLFAALRDAGEPEGKAGFIEEQPERPGTWRVHDLWSHAPEYVTRQLKRKLERDQNGETISRLRAEAGRKGGLARAANLQANGKQTADTCQANVATNAPLRSATPRYEAKDSVVEAAASSDPAAPPSLLTSAAGEAETTPPKAQPSASPKPDPSWERVAEVWTTVCVPAGFSAARGTTAQRKKAATRMREAGWFDAFRAACVYAAGTPFYRGDNDRGWAATLSWFLEPNNAEKTAERAGTKRAGGANGQRSEADREILAALERAEREASDPRFAPGDGRDGPGLHEPGEGYAASDPLAEASGRLSAAARALVVHRGPARELQDAAHVEPGAGSRIAQAEGPVRVA